MAVNLSRLFLRSYDLCCQTASPAFCSEYVSKGADIAIQTYLDTYEGCKSIFPTDTCRSMFSADISTVGNITYMALGALAGIVIGSLLKKGAP